MRPYAALLLMLEMLAATSAVNAGPLTNQTLSGSGNNLGQATAIVGPAAEFSFLDGFGEPFTLDFDDDGLLTITGVLQDGDMLFLSGNAYTFGDLNGTIPAIVGLSFVSASGAFNFSAGNSAFTANSLTIDFGGSTWAGSGTRTAQFQIRFEAAPVPEPAAAGLVGLGLLGLLFARRQRPS